MERKTYYSAPGYHGKFASPFWTTASLSDLGRVTTLPCVSVSCSEVSETRWRRLGGLLHQASGSSAGALHAERGARFCAVALGAPSPGDRVAAVRASPRGARPKDTQSAGRWASYPGVHRPHGSLSDRCLAKRPAPNQGSAGEDRGRVRSGGAVGQRPTHKPPDAERWGRP